MDYKYKISVIMAVYNSALFLREAIDSLIAQDIGFENIQLIMVNDGSTDDSAIICNEYASKYPNNILSVHKMNGGVSSARNEGLNYATGKYFNFMDSDDKLDTNAFSQMYNFIEKNYDITDAVAIPIKYFDGETGEHFLNYKFNKGTRLIDLDKEWKNIHMNVTNSLYKKECFSDLLFDERLKYAEDAMVAQKILSQKHTLGVVNNTYYHYRKRRTGEESALQKSGKNKEWYLGSIYQFANGLINYCNEKYSYTPLFVQNAIMYDLQWRFKFSNFYEGLFTEEEKVYYRKDLTNVIQKIDDEVIMAQKFLSKAHKFHIIKEKYSNKYIVKQGSEDVEILFNDKVVFCLSDIGCRLELIEFDNNNLLLDARMQFYPGFSTDKIYIRLNDEYILTETFNRFEQLLSLDTPIAEYKGFLARIPLDKLKKENSISIYIYRCGQFIRIKRFFVGPYSPLCDYTKYNKSYYVKNNFKLYFSKHGLHVDKINLVNKIKSEIIFLWEINLKNQLGSKKAILARTVYHLLKAFKRKPLWLISDRAVKADDNGLALFMYMQKNHPEVNSYFVINENCNDYKMVKTYGPVLKRNSFVHKLAVLLADYNISSQAEIEIYNPFIGHDDPYRNILADKKFVFLQHGIIKDNLSNWLNKYRKNLYGFVVSANSEYKSILNKENHYFYTEKQVWLTGLPRFDRLYQEEKNRITIMPTWRKYLMERWDKEKDIWHISPNIKGKQYYIFYNNLINNKKLLLAADKLGYKICFFPHPTMQDHITIFDKNEKVDFFGRETSYRDVYAQSNLIVSDYSSAVFDFAYLKKPLIYTHFDKEEFFAGEHVYTKGYFDYERDGFGEVEYTLEDTVNRIIEYMKNNCQMKDKYKQRVDKFFAFNDKNNCQRVYEKIMELENK